MKREFLQNLGGQALPKEVIDAILDENGKDIAHARAEAVKPYADHDALKQERDRLQTQLEQVTLQHNKQLEEVRFQAVLGAAIEKAKGRNAKAITALLDVDALRGENDPQTAIEKALAALKQEQGYLFLSDVPPYAAGTGVQNPAANHSPVTLAGALREKFERK